MEKAWHCSVAVLSATPFSPPRTSMLRGNDNVTIGGSLLGFLRDTMGTGSLTFEAGNLKERN